MSRGLLNRALNYIADHAWKGYGTSVDISDRTSSNKYTIPSDGIVTVMCTYRSASYIQLFVEDNVMVQQSSPNNANFPGNTVVSVPVFKGQSVYVVRSSSYSTATFRPFINAGGVLPNFAIPIISK